MVIGDDMRRVLVIFSDMWWSNMIRWWVLMFLIDISQKFWERKVDALSIRTVV